MVGVGVAVLVGDGDGVGVFDSGGTVQSLHVECSLTMIPEVSGVKRVKPIMI